MRLGSFSYKGCQVIWYQGFLNGFDFVSLQLTQRLKANILSCNQLRNMLHYYGHQWELIMKEIDIEWNNQVGKNININELRTGLSKL